MQCCDRIRQIASTEHVSTCLDGDASGERPSLPHCARLMRSAVIPPIGATRNTGIWLAKPTDPSSKPEPVILYTSHDCATVCIQVPIREISCPPKKSWKFRWRRARPAGCQREPPPLGLAESFWMAVFESATGTISLMRNLPEYHYIVESCAISLSCQAFGRR